MKSGCTLVVECGAVNWDEFNCEGIMRLWHDLFSHYPFLLKDVWFYNTTSKGAELLTYFGLQTLSERTMQRIYLGCEMLMGGSAVNLNDLFSFSSKAEHQKQMLQDLKGLLKARYQSEETFCL